MSLVFPRDSEVVHAGRQPVVRYVAMRKTIVVPLAGSRPPGWWWWRTVKLPSSYSAVWPAVLRQLQSRAHAAGMGNRGATSLTPEPAPSTTGQQESVPRQKYHQSWLRWREPPLQSQPGRLFPPPSTLATVPRSSAVLPVSFNPPPTMMTPDVSTDFLFRDNSACKNVFKKKKKNFSFIF